jgi:hypothetical protein
MMGSCTYCNDFKDLSGSSRLWLCWIVSKTWAVGIGTSRGLIESVKTAGPRLLSLLTLISLGRKIITLTLLG